LETVSAYEAKTHLPGLLRRVQQGERFTITRHGVPIAVLQPLDEDATADPAEAIARLREFRRGKRLDGLSIRELIDEGRR
jgi:prevent-host-death family protein